MDAESVDLGELADKLGITATQASADAVSGSMPVAGNRQPFGLLNGGATVAFGETLASVAASLHAEALGMAAVGVDINATHHHAVRSGRVTGRAVALHLGKRTCTHQVDVHDDEGNLVSTIRLTSVLVAR
jgi:uncharacterized protein (TIGR00369 family)